MLFWALTLVVGVGGGRTEPWEPVESGIPEFGGHVLRVCHLSQGRAAEQSDLLGPMQARPWPPLWGLPRCSLRALVALTSEIPDTVAGFGGALQEDFAGGRPWGSLPWEG